MPHFFQNQEDDVTAAAAPGPARVPAQRRDAGIPAAGPPGSRPHRAPSLGFGPTVTAHPESCEEMHRHLRGSQGGGQ